MFQVIGWTVVAAFVATTITTLLALTNAIELANEAYLDRLFTALIVEIIAAGFFLFRWGMKSPPKGGNVAEHAYFVKARSLFQEAQQEKEKGNFEDADRLLGSILRISVDDLPFEIRRVFRQRGDLAFEKQMWQQATNAYSTYYEISPDDLDALVRYGRSLRETNRYDDALEIYERAQRLSPNNYDTLNGLQNITRRMGGFFQEADRPDTADRYFEKARGHISSMLKIAPSKNADQKRYLNAILARARLYWQWERYPESIGAFEDIIQEFPDFPNAREDLAAVYLEEAERKNDHDLVEKASALYAELLDHVEDDEHRVFIGAGLAEAVARLKSPTTKQLADAERAARASLAKIDTIQEDPYPFFSLSLLLRKKGDRVEAERYLREAIRHERRRAADPYRFDYRRLVKYEKLLQRWTELDPSHLQPHV